MALLYSSILCRSGISFLCVSLLDSLCAYLYVYTIMAVNTLYMSISCLLIVCWKDYNFICPELAWSGLVPVLVPSSCLLSLVEMVALTYFFISFSFLYNLLLLPGSIWHPIQNPFSSQRVLHRYRFGTQHGARLDSTHPCPGTKWLLLLRTWQTWVTPHSLRWALVLKFLKQ